MKKLFLTLIVAFATVCGFAQEKVWENPAVDRNSLIEGFVSTLAEITRVEFTKDETRVYMHLSCRPDRWLRFSRSTYLQADGKRYAVRSCDGLELGKETFLTDNGKADVVFHFEPLPLNTRKFDFKEGDAEGDYCILGVESAATKATDLFPTAWRNTKNGDWEIAFYNENVIYDCRFWNYKERKQRGDKYEFLLECNGEELAVKVGKNRNGHRNITIGKRKCEYEIISTITLPDYAQKDTISRLKDNGYQQVDTVTLTGWLRGAPKYKMERVNGRYGVIVENILKGKEEIFFAAMDSLGRFTIKIPLLNTTEVFMDWNITFIRNILEPGETYFLLYDLEKGHKLFMGKNARLQNEILSHPIPWSGFDIEYEDVGKITAPDVMQKYLPELEKTEARFARLVEQHPSLSERYIQTAGGNQRCQFAAAMTQASYSFKERRVTNEYMDFVLGLQNTLPEPAYTFCRDYGTALWDVATLLKNQKYAYVVDDNGKRMIKFDRIFPYILERYRDAGKIEITDEELVVIGKWAEASHLLYRELENIPGTEERSRLEDEFYESALSNRAKSILGRDGFMKIIDTELPTIQMYAIMDVTEPLGYNRVLREILAICCLHKSLERDKEPLPPLALQYIQENITFEPLKESILLENDRLVAIMNGEQHHAASLRSHNDVAGLSDGEEILRKLLEPLKGKVVIIDVWGTWCAPCREALSESQKEYARLNKYDVAYLYLANQSPIEMWENTIKLFNVTGENVYHYNLPDIQQRAVGEYLKVDGYPFYRVVDRSGNILDIEVDARDLDALENVIKTL